MKLGEEAYVPLARFTLRGPRGANLRHSFSRGEREGLEVEIVPKERVPDILPELVAISNAWLESHETREKAFPLGAFPTDYIAPQSVAVGPPNNPLVPF